MVDCEQEKGAYGELLVISSAYDHDIDSDIDQEQRQTLLVTAEQVDPVCVKLNELLRRGKIDKKHIFYKYLNDVLEIFFDPFHSYDKDVIEFFNSITYLGGRIVKNFDKGTHE